MKQIAVVTTIGNHDEAARAAKALVERGIAAYAASIADNSRSA